MKNGDIKNVLVRHNLGTNHYFKDHRIVVDLLNKKTLKC